MRPRPTQDHRSHDNRQMNDRPPPGGGQDRGGNMVRDHDRYNRDRDGERARMENRDRERERDRDKEMSSHRTSPRNSGENPQFTGYQNYQSHRTRGDNPLPNHQTSSIPQQVAQQSPTAPPPQSVDNGSAINRQSSIDSQRQACF